MKVANHNSGCSTTFNKQEVVDDDEEELHREYSICDTIGSLGFIYDQGDTTEVAHMIGLGPSLFLMSTKAMSWFFFLLSITNIPLIWIYYVQGLNDAGHNENNGRLDKILYHVTLGHAANNKYLETPNGVRFNYETLGYMIIVFEIFTVCFFSYFISRLIDNQKKYIKRFKG